MDSFECIPLPTPYPVGRINTYVTPGEAPALVDTGVFSEKSNSELRAGLAELGLDFEELGFILITHPHQDHSGAAVHIAREYGVPVICHADALLDEEQGRSDFLELFERFGATKAMTAKLELAWQLGAGFGEPLSAAESADTVDGGDVVAAGDCRLEAIHTPGHSHGHLCFLDAEHELLLCGDLLLEAITSNPLPHFDRSAPHGRRPTLTLYLESLARIEALGPLRGLPGHGAPLDDTAERARQARSHIERRNSSLLQLLVRKPGISIFEVAQRHFGEATIPGQALAFCEVLAHCDLLEERGLIEIDHETGRASPL